jgi:HTH-type transcriptional regulator/antitoxin MqsA
MKDNICPICGKGPLKKEVIEEKFTYKGETIKIPNYVVYKCDACNETIVDKGTLKSSSKLLRNFKCKVDGLLVGDAIKGIRKKLNLTQEQMSEILGGGLKSFARYESGQICQSRAMDNLLRILDKYPDVIHIILKKPLGEYIHQKDENIVKRTKVIYLSEYFKKKYVYEKRDFDTQMEGVAYGT